MRILWLKSDYIAPPDTGGKIRTYNLLRELRKYCDVTYASFRGAESVDDLQSIHECAQEVMTFYRPEEVKSGLGFYSRVVRGMRSQIPYIVQKYRSPMFGNVQRQWVEKMRRDRFDGEAVVVCDFLEMSENVDWSVPVPKILFQHNVESTIWRRYQENESNPGKRAYFAFEYRRMKAYESAVCNKFDLVFTVSQEDKSRLLDEYGVDVPIGVLETGVDVEYFAPRPEVKVVPGSMVFLGSLDWMPNIDGLNWFISEVYPLIRERVPHATLRVVGRRPVEAVHRLVDGDDSIQVIPDVDDVRPHVAGADLFVVPLRIGGGSRIKIYEAMAMGCPVLSTSIGAEGLPLTAGEHIAIGDSPLEFARCAESLAHDAAQKTRMAQQGRRFVTANYPWSRIAAHMYERCQAVARARPLEV